MSKERRKAPRFEARLFMELESSPVGRGVVVDMSTTGFAVETEAELSQGSEYICHLEVPMTVRARVVRRLSGGQVSRYGLQIIGQSILDRLVMRKIIKGPRRTRKL